MEQDCIQNEQNLKQKCESNYLVFTKEVFPYKFIGMIILGE